MKILDKIIEETKNGSLKWEAVDRLPDYCKYSNEGLDSISVIYAAAKEANEKSLELLLLEGAVREWVDVLEEERLYESYCLIVIVDKVVSNIITRNDLSNKYMLNILANNVKTMIASDIENDFFS